MLFKLKKFAYKTYIMLTSHHEKKKSLLNKKALLLTGRFRYFFSLLIAAAILRKANANNKVEIALIASTNFSMGGNL